MKAIYFFVMLLLCSCSSKTMSKKESLLSKKDSIEVEESMNGIKNITFNECYYKSKLNTYKRLGVNDSNECFSSLNKKVKDLTGYYYMNNSFINPKWIFDDKNRDKLLNKWINDKKYIPFVNPPDFPDGSIDMVRALDFYNSKDMAVYIDSLRIVRIKEIITEKK
jgi:hypothetical protein